MLGECSILKAIMWACFECLEPTRPGNHKTRRFVQ